MEIKTVISSQTWVGDFDNRVNAALADGWRLARRDVLPNTCHLYAELVKLDPPAEAEEPDLLAAMRIIKETCSSVNSCADCPVQPWCNFHAPDKWALPEEVQDDGE